MLILPIIQKLLQMKYIFLIFLFPLSIATKSQQRIEYGNFLQQDKQIEWAAVYHSILDLSTVNPNYDLWKFYQRKLSTGNVSIYKQDSTSFAVERSQKMYADYKAGILNIPFSKKEMNWAYDFSDGSNASESVFRNEISACDSCLFNDRFSLMKVKQLIYYKNHTLYVQDILMQLVFYTKLADASKEDATYYVADAVAFNDSLNESENIPAGATFIARTSNMLDLSLKEKSENAVLTNANSSLSLILYKDIKKGYINAFATERSLIPSGNYLPKEKLDSYQNPPIEVPYYDENGNVLGIRKMVNEINFDSLCRYTLIQDIYFDFAKEKLYSKVITLIPLRSIVTSMGIDLGLAPYWGVDFRKKIIAKKK